MPPLPLLVAPLLLSAPLPLPVAALLPPAAMALLPALLVAVPPLALVAMVASEVPQDRSVAPALVVWAASPESELLVATAEMPVQEEAEARAVWAWVGLLFWPLIVMARPAEEVATLVHQVPVETVRYLELRATVPLAATPVTAGLAGTSPAQTNMAALVATAVVAVAQPAQARLAMAAAAAAAVLLAMGRSASMAGMAARAGLAALVARPLVALRATAV